MKTLFKCITILFFTTVINAQSKYEQKMGKAMRLWNESKIEKASNLFEEIAKEEKENWLPFYYVALVNVTSTFYTKDKSGIQSQLVKAQENLDLSKTYSPRNPENIVLQALLYTAEMLQDIARKAPTLVPKIEGLYQKALAMAPQNPRVVAGFADWKYNSAKHFKQEVTPYCDALKKAILLFNKEKSSIPFAPTWGKERAQTLINQCGV